MVCSKDGSKHHRGIPYRRMPDVGRGGKSLNGAGNEGSLSGPLDD
jgi:hypothetical protein